MISGVRELEPLIDRAFTLRTSRAAHVLQYDRHKPGNVILIVTAEITDDYAEVYRTA